MNFFLNIIIPLMLSTLSHADMRSVELTVQDGKFSPTEIEIKTDETVMLSVINTGTEAEEFESLALHKEKIILPQQTLRFKVGPLRKGTYRFFGDFHPTTAVGALIVK